MAALDPTAPAQTDEENPVLRATLKLIRVPMDMEDSDDEDEDYDPEDIEAITARLREAGAIPEESSDEDDSESEKNGGPSDPVKSKKAKQAALTKKLQEALEADEMEIDSSALTNGKAKGKAKITDVEVSDEDDEDSEDDEGDDEPEEFVLCTLNPENVRWPAENSAPFRLTHPSTTSSRSTSPSARARRSTSASLVPTTSTSPVTTLRSQTRTARMMTRTTVLSSLATTSALTRRSSTSTRWASLSLTT
jgi:hypothetical protein